MVDTNKLTIEYLGRKDYQMYQIKDGFRFGTDAVLLAWFTASHLKSNRKYKALELGSNTGACSLLLSARRPDVDIDAIEIDEDAYEVCNMNIKLNKLEGKMRAFRADVRDLSADIPKAKYDVVFMNPPFFSKDNGPRVSEEKAMRLKGRFEENGVLTDFIEAGASRLIPSHGIMCVIMAASRTAELIALMEKNKVKIMNIMPVHPFVDRKAEMVLICGKRTDTKPQMSLLQPLILNEKMEDSKICQTKRIIDIYEEEHHDCFI
ncbi:MAG: methyltransferase [Saccharofermentans sp.]|nr:methyltransferase [Saccharofermentans sp.]